MLDSKSIAAGLDSAVESVYADEWSAVFRNYFLLNGGDIRREHLQAALRVADAVTEPFTLRTMGWRPLKPGWQFRLDHIGKGVTLTLVAGDRTPEWNFLVERDPDTLVRYLA